LAITAAFNAAWGAPVAPDSGVTREMMAAQIRANGKGVDDVAEHMYQTPIDAPR
jgi:hypothetical protein